MSVSVCVSVCLSVRDRIFGTTRPIFTKFLCMLPMTVARSSSWGAVMCYVFLVLWLTWYLHISWNTEVRILHRTYRCPKTRRMVTIKNTVRKLNIQVCVQLPKSAVNVALPAFAAERRAATSCCRGAGRAAINRYFLFFPDPQQQTSRTLLQRANGTDGRTNRETDGHRAVT